MFVYRDMCFCPFYEKCTEGKKCFRALTEKVFKGAAKEKLPIDRFAEYPTCFVEKIKKVLLRDVKKAEADYAHKLLTYGERDQGYLNALVRWYELKEAYNKQKSRREKHAG